ncbi:MAG: hypothetical protein ACK57G_02965 [Planctomycetota bacterium]
MASYPEDEFAKPREITAQVYVTASGGTDRASGHLFLELPSP